MTTLAEAVNAAVAALLADRVEIPCGEVLPLLPEAIRRGNPSIKAVRQAVAAQGWTTAKLVDGTPVFRAPGHASDPLNRPGEPGGNMAADELRLLIERAERLEEEKKGIADDIKDVFAEAKGRGYDPKTMRKVLSIRKKKREEYQEEEAILEVYLQALGMV